MARAVFVLGDSWDPVKAAGRVVTGALGLPVPLPIPSRPVKDRGTGLPDAFELEVADEEVRVLAVPGGEELETWPRGALWVTVRQYEERVLGLDLHWREGGRGGRVAAAATEHSRAVTEWLLHDDRVARGAPREADAAFVRLLLALPAEALVEHHANLRPVSALLTEDERPERLAVASYGGLLLTDARLLWWDGGRKDPMVLARTEVMDASVPKERELEVFTASERHWFFDLLPDEAPAAFRDALRRPAADALELAAKRAGDRVVWPLLEPIRELLQAGEEVERLDVGYLGWRTGALVLTDRQLLWVNAKRPARVHARASVLAATASERGELEVATPGAKERFTFERDGAAADFAAALSEPLEGIEPPDALEAAARELDDDVVWPLLPILRDLLTDEEDVERLVRAFVSFRQGALLLTDRRLLWAHAKRPPRAIDRADVTSATTMGGGLLRVSTTSGEQVFGPEPHDEAAGLAAALDPA